MKEMSLTKYLISLLFIIIGILIIINWNTLNKLENSLNEVKDYKFKYSIYEDSLGREHVNYKQLEHRLNELNSQDRSLVDKTAKSLGTKSSNIKSVTQVSTLTIAPIFLPSDTPSFNDGHLSINTDKTDSGLIGTYTYKDTCWFTTYTKSKRFIGIKYKEETFGNIHFGNPNTKITGLNSISISKFTKPKHFAIGPVIGVTYNGSIQPFVGFGVMYKLISF